METSQLDLSLRLCCLLSQNVIAIITKQGCLAIFLWPFVKHPIALNSKRVDTHREGERDEAKNCVEIHRKKRHSKEASSVSTVKRQRIL